MQGFLRRTSLVIPLLGLLLHAGERPAAAVDAAYIAGGVVVAGARVFAPHDFEAIAEFDYGWADFGDLANFTGYRFTPDGSLDAPREFRYRLRSENLRGFRLGLRFRDQLSLVWSRLWADSAYQVWVDGVEAESDPEGAIRVQIPEVEVRLDMLILAWRIEKARFAGITPVVHLGYGWILQRQQGPFQAPFRPAVNNSDSDDAYELGAGLEGNWGVFQLGAELRGFTWRWESNDPNVPASQVWSWIASLRAGLVF